MATSPGTSVAFIMQHIRAVLRAYPDFGARLQGEVQAIEDTAANYPENCIALAKKLVESCCKTVLNECGKPAAENCDVQTLFRSTLNELGFFVPGHPDNRRISDSVKQAGRSLHSAIQAIAEIRNVQGVDHGAPADWPSLLPVHAAFVAATVDAITALLLETHRSESAGRKPPLRYADNPDFNDYVDEEHPPLSLFGVDYRPSEVLFAVDQTAYETYLADFRADEPNQQTINESVGEAIE